MEIGKKISGLRKSKDITQEALAAEMGVSIAAVSKWETGNSLPDLYMLCAIADFFNVTTDELLGRKSNKKKVIVVDDAKFMRETIKGILTENGLDVIGEAGDGNELLSLLQQKKVDMITLDIKMPGMDGISALDVVSKDYPNVKVIMITAVTDMDIANSISSKFSKSIVGFVSKPFKPEYITSMLRTIQ